MFVRRASQLIITFLVLVAGITAVSLTTHHASSAESGASRHCTGCGRLAAAGAAPSFVAGELKKWHPVTIDFTGPLANETDDAPNPFLDYRLQVTLTGPQGQAYNVPGYFAGDGQGNGRGHIWRAIFAPDATGAWQYTASFRAGINVAVDLNPEAGTPAGFDGASGSFVIGPPSCTEPGFLRWGRLTYVGNHYLKFADGGYWIKGGTNSPENFLAYAGFDNTIDQGGLIPNFLHTYAEHSADWREGDPNFFSADTGYDAKGIIGALNYLAERHVNSIYFLPMNLGGDGQEVYPFIGYHNTPYDKTHYDVSKLDQWRVVFDHAQRQGIALQVVLAETEAPNEQWLDGGGLNVERKLFYRELIARFGYLLALKWNLSEENDYPVEQLQAFADFIRALDWAGHPIAVHTYLDDFSDYEQLLGDDRFTATSIQYTSDLSGPHVDAWRILSSQTGRPWIIDMDENYESLTSSNEDELRKRVLYPVYFSGGNIEWYLGYHDLPLGGDLQLENFRTRDKMWIHTWFARQFMQENLPFWEMIPQDGLLSGEDDTKGPGHVFARPGEIYAVYLPVSSRSGVLDLAGAPGVFTLRWYDPRAGLFVGETTTVMGGGTVHLGAPPFHPSEDWVILLKRTTNAAFYQGENETYLPAVMKPCLPAALP